MLVSSCISAVCDSNGVEYIADDSDECHYWLCVHGIQYGAFPCLDGLRIPEGATGSIIHDVCNTQGPSQSFQGVTSSDNDIYCPRTKQNRQDSTTEPISLSSLDSYDDRVIVRLPRPTIEKNNYNERNPNAELLSNFFTTSNYDSTIQSRNMSIEEYFVTEAPSPGGQNAEDDQGETPIYVKPDFMQDTQTFFNGCE